MRFPLVRDLAAEGSPVRLTCGVLGFTAQAYYSWLANPVSDRDLQDAYLVNALLDAPRRPGLRLPVPRRRARPGRHRGRGAPGLAAVLPAAPVVHDGAQGPPRQGQARPGRA
jgi:hypothetical protein